MDRWTYVNKKDRQKGIQIDTDRWEDGQKYGWQLKRHNDRWIINRQIGRLTN